MAWLTAAMAGVGIVSSLMGSNAEQKKVDARNAAAREQNKAAIEKAKRQYEWDMMAFGRNEAIADINYAWDMAKHTALLVKEEEARVDYEWAQGRMLENAKANLKLNSEALYDQYVTAEKLRGTQEQMRFDYEVANLQQGLLADMAGYINQVQNNSLSANRIVQTSTEEVQALLSSITLDNEADMLERDIQTVAAMVDEGNVKARMYARNGGTSTAVQAQQNIAKALGRSYGQLKLEQTRRNAALDQRNAAMAGSTATQLLQYAKASEGMMDQARFAEEKANRDLKYTQDVFEKLTIPGFELAKRQGLREMDALAIRTQAEMDNASMPFRKSITFEPQRALPGFKPMAEQYRPQLVNENMKGPSSGDVIMGAVMGGVSGALQGATTNKNGDLKFL